MIGFEQKQEHCVVVELFGPMATRHCKVVTLWSIPSLLTFPFLVIMRTDNSMPTVEIPKSVQETSDSSKVKITFPTYAQVASDAAACDGLAYGGYVRDAVVLQVEANDMDVWFARDQEAEVFEHFIKTHYGAVVFNDAHAPHVYPFKRKRVNIVKPHRGAEDAEEYLNIDIVVCKTFPVNDFNVNLLTWDGVDVGVHQPDAVRFDESRLIATPPVFYKDEIIDCIKNRIMFAFPTYTYRGTLKQGSTEHQRQWRMDTFERRGWTVMRGPAEFDWAKPQSVIVHMQCKAARLEFTSKQLREHAAFLARRREAGSSERPTLKRKLAVCRNSCNKGDECIEFGGDAGECGRLNKRFKGRDGDSDSDDASTVAVTVDFTDADVARRQVQVTAARC
jgi:hypothetical protein